MEQFGDLATIDYLAKKYPQYKHDDIFELDCDFVYSLLYMDVINADIHHRANSAKQKLEKSRQKQKRRK